jgi:acetolactate decarboxylase
MRFSPPARRLAVLAFVLLLAMAGRLSAADLYQVSTMQALSAGLADGLVPISTVARHGNFGLGTLHGFNGELVALDGVFYQVRGDGTVHRLTGREKTPFAQVVSFVGPLDLGRLDGMGFEDMKKTLAARLPDPSKFYAVRVDGLFSAVTARSAGIQKEPWPSLAEVLKHQAIFPLENVQGTMVGIYSPPSAPGLSPTGWHFHFLTQDRTKGGHVLDAKLAAVKARGDAVAVMTVLFPDKPLPRLDAAPPAAGTE